MLPSTAPSRLEPEKAGAEFAVLLLEVVDMIPATRMQSVSFGANFPR